MHSIDLRHRLACFELYSVLIIDFEHQFYFIVRILYQRTG